MCKVPMIISIHMIIYIIAIVVRWLAIQYALDQLLNESSTKRLYPVIILSICMFAYGFEVACILNLNNR